MEHGTDPIADVYFDVIEGSTNCDAVASRNLHAVIYEARRLCKDL
ncbi:MAG: hypothetical protein ACFCVC_00405 [Acidimicrobiia bacterium]